MYFHLPFRQTEEDIAQGHAKGKVPDIPDYTTIHRRINRLDIKIENDDKSEEFEDDYLIIAIDSTGIKVTNRGQWLRGEKWNIRKGYLKTHVATVDVKNKKIISLKVTADEHVHDGKVLPKLVEDIKKSKHMTVGKILAADEAYDSIDILRYLLAVDNGILPFVKVRRSAIVKKTNNIFRNLSVISQKNDLQRRWKYSIVIYEKRGG